MRRQVPEGAKVKFRHGRWLVNGRTPIFWTRQEGETPEDRIIWNDLRTSNVGLIMSPRGGVTECTLTLPNGDEVWAEALCSKRDNYSKRIGRDISLGRALAEAERQYPELFKLEVSA